MPDLPEVKTTYIRVRNATAEIVRELPFTPLVPYHLPMNLIIDTTAVMTRTVSDAPEENSALFHQSLRSPLGSESISIFQYKEGMLPLFPEPIGYVKEEQAVSIKERSARLVVLERGGEDITVLSTALRKCVPSFD